MMTMMATNGNKRTTHVTLRLLVLPQHGLQHGSLGVDSNSRLSLSNSVWCSWRVTPFVPVGPFRGVDWCNGVKLDGPARTWVPHCVQKRPPIQFDPQFEQNFGINASSGWVTATSYAGGAVAGMWIWLTSRFDIVNLKNKRMKMKNKSMKIKDKSMKIKV